jgi:hypothetical protein
MKIPAAVHGYGCASGLINMGGFIAGIYMGLANSKGHSLDPTTINLIKYTPVVLNAGVGFFGGIAMGSDQETLDEMIRNNPRPISPFEVPGDSGQEQAVGCYRNCMPPLAAVAIAGSGWLFTYAGYVTGNIMGSQF